jgi:hypothetical protein
MIKYEIFLRKKKKKNVTSFVRSSTRTIESLVTPSKRGTSLFLPDIFS